MRHEGKNASFLRESNKKILLNIIRTQKVSRADLARITGLTRPTVSSIVEQLISEGFIMECGVDEITRGRHPEILSLRPKHKYAIGVDISRDKCSYGLVDITGNIICSDVVPLDKTSPPVITVLSLCKAIKKMLEKQNINMNNIIGLGLCLPGPIDVTTGTIINPPHFDSWHNFNIVQQFQQEFDTFIRVENKATSHALAEILYGTGMKYNNYFVLLFIDGVGSAGIVNGIPYRGMNGFNSEFGHVSIDMNGPLCQCGNRGCLELYTSIPVIVEQVRRTGLAVRDWDDIVELALSGNMICLNVIKVQAKHLSFAITNIINTFFPEAVILAGKLQYKPELLLNFIKNEVFSHLFAKSIYTPQILVSNLKGNVEVLGASSIIINTLFTQS